MADRLIQEYGLAITVEWKAFELRPESAPTLDPKGDYLKNAGRDRVYPLARERGMTLHLPPVQPRTRLAFQAAEFARERGKFDAMHRVPFEAFFVEGRDIGQLEVLAAIASAIGRSAIELTAALESRTYLNRVLEQKRLGLELGITGVPCTLVRGDPRRAEPVIGAVPYERLRAAVERALHRYARSSQRTSR